MDLNLSDEGKADEMEEQTGLSAPEETKVDGEPKLYDTDAQDKAWAKVQEDLAQLEGLVDQCRKGGLTAEDKIHLVTLAVKVAKDVRHIVADETAKDSKLRALFQQHDSLNPDKLPSTPLATPVLMAPAAVPLIPFSPHALLTRGGGVPFYCLPPAAKSPESSRRPSKKLKTDADSPPSLSSPPDGSTAQPPPADLADPAAAPASPSSDIAAVDTGGPLSPFGDDKAYRKILPAPPFAIAGITTTAFRYPLAFPPSAVLSPSPLPVVAGRSCGSPGRPHAATALGKRKRRGRPPADNSKLVCSKCGVHDTPEWRRGPDGPKTLCNACGLQWAKAAKTGAARAVAGATATGAETASAMAATGTTTTAIATTTTTTTTATAAPHGSALDSTPPSFTLSALPQLRPLPSAFPASDLYSTHHHTMHALNDQHMMAASPAHNDNNHHHQVGEPAVVALIAGNDPETAPMAISATAARSHGKDATRSSML